jgi:hypothetical protein
MTQITGQKADSFSAKLNQALNALDWKTRNDLLLKIGKMELRMRASGLERPQWLGPISEDKILGADVVIPTDQGERRGTVICFGVVHMGGENWEKSVIVHVPASGTQHEGPGSAARLATPEDLERIQSEMTMAERLKEAADAAQKGAVAPSPEKARKRGQRDPELVKELHALASAHPNVKSVEEGGTNYKITGLNPNKRIYLFKTQLRADLSGFSVDHPGIRKISDDEARDMHLGKVRGQLTFDDRAGSKAAFEAALAQLKS